MERLSDFETNKRAIRARKRIETIKEFYKHLITYCLFTPFIIFVNYVTYWDSKWFWYTIIPWGIGLVIHACIVFINRGAFASRWEERKIEELMRKEENKWQ